MNKIVWTIGGSDSGGGAGIQADIKTFNALGVHGCSVITAITAQNTIGANKIEQVSPAMLESQIQTLAGDLPPAVIKTGMLYITETIKQVASFFSTSKAFKICDPVMIATTGSSLLSSTDTLQALIDYLLPTVDLLTPNLPEAEALLGIKNSSSKTQDESYIKELANSLLALGPKAVLIKGGHSGGAYSNDYFQQKNDLEQNNIWQNNYSAWLLAKRVETDSNHGTGCTLSAAIAACIARGYSLLDAIVIAKAYVTQGLRIAKKIGKGHGPIAHGQWPENFADLPILLPATVSNTFKSSCLDLPSFPDCGKEKLGVYPIVDNASWLEKLLPLGITTAQLRIKAENNSLAFIEEEIIKAVNIAKQFSCRLFINDHWQLAIKHQAYGVHLGQEDLDTADMEALLKSGMRLGLSTHTYTEVARALAYKPSYIAIGPIFSTSTKTMSWQSQGLENLKRWRRSLPYPLVAIAGINLQNLSEVLEAGADGIAVIKDILSSSDPISQTKNWLNTYETASHTTKLQCHQSN